MSVEPAAEETFGPYLVYERLGVGGMATVHRALEQGADGFQRTIALKRLLPHLAEDASFIKSFVREAKLASILNHINIVQIYELGRVGTEYFISMEYIDGRDLRRILRHARKVTGAPPVYVTVGLLIQLCDALDYAHNKVDEDGVPMRLVHRDISPSNLIVTSSGHLKVIDFGIAKAESSQLRTQTGRIKGKLAYMAPEAISGSRDLDARSDIWACGVIAHELATARPLFASKNEYQTLLKVQRGDIMPPSTYNQACPAELDAIVFKALARHADDRYATAGEMRDDLIALKRKYALQTGYREIASWIEWAFGLEAPPGPSGFPSGDTSGVVAMPIAPPTAANADEEEAVQVVWGGGEVESEDGSPVVLDDIPDVSEKVRSTSRMDTVSESSLSMADDIPTPQPSHGVLPSIYGEIKEPLARGAPGASGVARGSAAIPKQQMTPQAQPAARPPGVAQRITSSQPAAKPRSGVQPTVQPPVSNERRSDQQRVQRPTGLGPAARTSDRMPVQRQTRGPGAPPIDPRVASFKDFDDQTHDEHATAAAAELRLEDGYEPAPPLDLSLDPGLDPGGMELGGPPPLVGPGPGPVDLAAPPQPVSRLSAEELFSEDAGDVLAGISARMEAMATRNAMSQFNDEGVTNPEIKAAPSLPSVPVVRFSKSMSVPPPVAGDPNKYPTGGLDPMRSGVPQTKPGVAPVAAITAPRQLTPVGARVPSNVVDPRTPSNSLSNPRVASNSLSTARVPSNSVSMARTPSNVVGGLVPPPVPPVQVIEKKKSKTWLIVLALVLIAGGAATFAVLAMSGSEDSSASPRPAPTPAPSPEAPPAPAVGKVKIVTEPADAEIKIEGKVVHTGSPFVTELPAGIHKVEIHKQGFKAWLTSVELSVNETASLRVVLEPITEAVAEDASLTITTDPADLEVYIDGELLPQKTPIKTAIKPGAHKIAVRQNGVDVWQQDLVAEAASDYEFNPSFTDDKKRERAQRTNKAPRAPAPPPAPTAPSGSASGAPPAGSASGAGSGTPPPIESLSR